jgi:competence protein ComEC
MRVVAAVPACGLLAGCALGVRCPELAPFAFVILLLVLTALAVQAYRRPWPRVLLAAVALGFGAGGVRLAQIAWRDAWRPTLRLAFESIAQAERVEAERHGEARPLDDRVSVVLVGVLREDAALSGGGAVSLDVDVRWVGRARSWRGGVDPAINPVEGGVLLTVAGTAAVDRFVEWRRGRVIRASAQLRRPSRYLDPGVPDQERVLARRGVTLVGTVKSSALVDVEAIGGGIAERAASVRAFTRRAVAASVAPWSARSAAIVTAILIGDRTGLDATVERRLQEAGTYHVIAISGGNIAILAGLMLAAFRLAGVLGRVAMLTAIAGLLAYGFLVTGGASVDRATVMAAIYFASRALDLRGPPFNTLALVAALLVLVNPLTVADPAFLLTFGATAAILAFVPDVPVQRVPRRVAPVVLLGAVSFVAEAALLPVGATFFSRITLAGLLLNFAAIPLMAIAQIAGMAVVPLFLVSTRLALAAGFIAHFGAEGLVRSADLVRVAPFLTWRVTPPSAFTITVYYAGALIAWALWRRRVQVVGSAESWLSRAGRRVSTVAAIAAACWILCEPWTIWRARGDGRLHLTFIDVGQGDSAFIRFPRGSTMLVDAGGLPDGSSFDIGDRIVAATLRRDGVRRLGTLVLTHGDADHIGGAGTNLAEFRPWDVWEGIPVPASVRLRALHTTARETRSRWTSLQTQDETAIDDVRVSVKHPAIPEWERQVVRNDDSIVLELRWRNVSIVLTGDIGTEVEQAIVGDFAPAPLRVVKVPHHGSATSSSEAFVRGLAPQVAVISVGRSNAFGHPAATVLERYQSIGAALFRTDRDGAINVDTDGTTLDIHTCTGRRIQITARQ